MRLRFTGSYARLRKCVSRTRVVGEWRKLTDQQFQFRTDDGAVLNWWKSTGTISFQGRKQRVDRIQKRFVRIASKREMAENGNVRDEVIARIKRRLTSALRDVAKLEVV